MVAKRNVYIFLVIILSLLLCAVFYCVLAIFCLSYAGCITSENGNNFCARLLCSVSSPPFVMLLAVAGICGGYYVGKVWWRIIYIEDRRHKKYKLDW